MVSKAPTLLVPATPVPMTPEIRGIVGNHNKVSNTYLDEALTTGAHVALVCLVGLDRMHHVAIEAVQRSR